MIGGADMYMAACRLCHTKAISKKNKSDENKQEKNKQVDNLKKNLHLKRHGLESIENLDF